MDIHQKAVRAVLIPKVLKFVHLFDEIHLGFSLDKARQRDVARFDVLVRQIHAFAVVIVPINRHWVFHLGAGQQAIGCGHIHAKILEIVSIHLVCLLLRA